MDQPPPIVLSPGVKRSHDGDVIIHDNATPLPQPAQPPSTLQRAASPALSTTSSLTELSSSGIARISATTASPTKKRKLTYAERQVQQAEKQREKAEKERLKAEEKARKEEEKRVRDEEKRKKAEEQEAARKVKEVEKAQKDAVKAAEKAARDAKKAEKDADKAKKEAEKLKKERAQLRLGAFFGPPAASSPPSTPDDVSVGVSSRRSSISSIDSVMPEIDVKAARVANPDYSKWILPFFPHEHTDIAPANRFLDHHLSHDTAPEWFEQSDQGSGDTPNSTKKHFGQLKPRRRNIASVKAIMAGLGGSEESPIDLTTNSPMNDAHRSLQKVPYKFLSFREDVRPPYQGTFTRSVSPRRSRILSRKPTQRGLPQIDYDYDSEAEWEAPEAGDEDLEDEDELSDDEDAADDMADFLDDEDEIARRRVTVADAEPVCTGLCWEGQVDSIAGIDLALYRMDVLSDDTRFPIDPYSATHWADVNKTTPLKRKTPMSEDTAAATMQPPRLPLTTVTNTNGSPMRNIAGHNNTLYAGLGQKENAAPSSQHAPNPKKLTKTIPPELMPAFKAAVSGSDLNKVALIEILKKQFPKCPKDAIKGTLENIAVRQGVKEADKRWVLTA